MNIYEDTATPALLDIAGGVSESLRVTDAVGAADLVDELSTRLAEHQLVDELAADGVGQRPPIALLLAGKDTEANVAAAADALAELTLNGFVVVEHCPPYDLDDEDTESMRQLLHRKVEMADVVNIVNVDGIDEALLPVIEFAETCSTPVQYTNPEA